MPPTNCLKPFVPFFLNLVRYALHKSGFRKVAQIFLNYTSSPNFLREISILKIPTCKMNFRENELSWHADKPSDSADTSSWRY